MFLETLAQLFEQGMRLAGGKVSEVDSGIYRIDTAPPDLKQLINDTVLITKGELQGALPKVAFDTAVFEQNINGRKIYRNKADTALLRLNHPLMKRLLGLFEKHMWGEDSQKIRRWTVVKSDEITTPLIEIHCLEQVTNELREVLHSEIKGFRFNPESGELTPIDSEYKEMPLAESELNNIRFQVAELWQDHSEDILDSINNLKKSLLSEITELSQSSFTLANEQEVKGFNNRKKYLRSQKGVNALNKLRKDIEAQETRLKQRSLFVEEDDARERQLREVRWQLE